MGVVAVLSLVAFAQSNGVPGLDLVLSGIGDAAVLARDGTFPDGVNGLGFATEVLDGGTAAISTAPAMDPAHPFLAFLLARESGGRLVQISDRSFLAHVSGALGSLTAAQNGDHFWLGPADEVHPWFGTWNPQCSHFDRGEPAVSPPADCDGARSLTAAQASLLDSGAGRRVRVRDADLDVSGADFWIQVQGVTAGEPESNRSNNLGSRRVIATWTGLDWTALLADPFLEGTVLQRWSGASVSSSTNQNADGRVYVAVKVTGPSNGLFHYEYALHNRDNARAVKKLRIPICEQAAVSNPGFRDLDADPSNDWTFVAESDEVVFETSANPLPWNAIFNFWFDSDAGPESGASLVLGQFLSGGGPSSFAVTSAAPLSFFNVVLGPGCGTPLPPTLFAVGDPPRAILGNATFGLESGGNAPGAPCILAASALDGSQAVAPGCVVHMLGTPYSEIVFFPAVVAGPSGVATFPLPVPNDPAVYEGVHVNFQVAEFQPGTGGFLDAFDLSNGLRVRLGSAIANCP